MSAYEQLERVVAGQGHQIALLRDQVEQLRRTGGGDRMVLEEWARLNGLTLAQAMGAHRNRAIRALRDGLSAARVARVFGLSRRAVQKICARGNEKSSESAAK